MSLGPDDKLLRVAVFYDGGFFSRVSDYYAYHHDRRARIDIHGLHRFIQREVAEYEGVEHRFCRIVESHYFRGRFSAKDAERAGKLLPERQFDEVLMRAGVVTHYLPMIGGRERGTDVALAVEALEVALLKRFNVLVLIAGDVDFVPLARKINALGTRLVLLSWDLEYFDQHGNLQVTRTAQGLMDEVAYSISMHSLVEDRSRRGDPMVEGMFLPSTRADEPAVSAPPPRNLASDGQPEDTGGEGDIAAPPARYTSYEVGELAEGVVNNVKDYGCFVTLDDDSTGLLHISEIADVFVEDPSDYAPIGSSVRVRILSIDHAQRRIELSLKGVPQP